MTPSTAISYGLIGLLVVILIWLIYRQVREYHLQDDPILHTLREIVKPITYNGRSIADGLKMYKGDKSYTINKSQTFLCLHDRHGKYYPLQMLLHVLLHERAHSLNTKDIGHTEEFHRILNELTQQAIKLGIYDPSIPLIPDYCEY